MSPPLTTSMTLPLTTPSAFDGFDVAPSPLVLRALLGKDQSTVFVFLLKNKSFDFIAHGNDLVRVDIVFDGKFTAWDDTFGLVADVEKDFVTVNLDDGSFDDVSVVEVLDGRIDGCQ